MKASPDFSLTPFLPAVAFLLFALLPAQAQNSLDEVHVAPRSDLESVSGSSPSTGPPLRSAGGVIKKTVDLVLVPVTITDTRDHPIIGLAKDNFQLFEGKKRQQIARFSDEDTAVSLGIVLDVSSSMSSKMERATEAMLDFCRLANPQDEFFLITFANQAELLQDFTTRTDDIQAKLLTLVPKGSTALLDAVYLGLSHMRQARYDRRALFIISDGGDNHSRYTEGEVKSMAREAGVAIYSVALFDRNAPTREEILGPELLEDIADVTGGSSYAVESPNVVPALAERVSDELRRQYVLAYRPQETPKDGKWHHIRIKLTLPRGIPPLLVRAKPGYYAPTR
ncbi:MAG TPA: VWA domain-containing protein [Candidatus Solibacter sp.]|nr:VWA domain-containing protein [Candidatus Solibacter sp.]